MFSPAFRLALERTLNDDITPEALESVFRISMRKMTDAKKCRTGINLSKNLLIAKIIHKTRNIIIAAKKDQELISLTSSVAANASPVLKAPCSSPSPKFQPPTDKSPLNETQPEPSSRTPATPAFSTRLKFQTKSGSQTVDENVAPLSVEGDTRRSHVSSPRPAKRPHGWFCGNSDNSSWTWTPCQPPPKVGRMDVDDSRESEAAQNPTISTSVTLPTAFASVTSSSGHVHHHQPPSPPPTNTTGLWSFCAKEQPNSNAVVPAIYSPYHQRLSMPLTTCPMRLSLAST